MMKNYRNAHNLRNFKSKKASSKNRNFTIGVLSKNSSKSVSKLNLSTNTKGMKYTNDSKI